MLEIRLAANKDVDYVILDVLIPLLASEEAHNKQKYDSFVIKINGGT